MNSLPDFFRQNFNTQRDQWEKSLRSELKTDDIGAKISKKSADGTWPTLSLDAPVVHQLRPREAWKKAAQTYIRIPADIEICLQEDLDGGVRLFFFEKNDLLEVDWKKIAKIFNSFKDVHDLVVVLTGDKKISSGKNSFKVIDEDQILSGRRAMALGGNSVQELALLTRVLIDKIDAEEIHVGVFLDSDFFRNIAKVRAARLLALKVFEHYGVKKKLNVIGLTSYRDWTLYERYSNLLRNDVSVASGLIAGCDFVQSSGYQSLFELETDLVEPDHTERSRRMARNTFHILSLESILGLVDDASFGSYHLENLTEKVAGEAWVLMQKLLPMNDGEISAFFQRETTSVSEQRQKNLATRRHVLAGLNDFPDVKDTLKLNKLPEARFFRSGRKFEELRLQMENSSQRPDVYLAILGDYAALNARINFVKNYFELLGLKVIDPGRAEEDKVKLEKSIAQRTEKILMLVCADDQYVGLSDIKTQAREKYLAGKTELPGFTNLFSGQNVLDVLTSIVDRWGNK